jgi:hypothetical protein
MILKGCEIERDKIHEYFTPENMQYIEYYMNYKIFDNNFPYAGGWAEQPCHLIDLIKTLKVENNKWQMTR